jgi:integrase/recombinase XerD
LLEDIVAKDPTTLLEAPKLLRQLPDVLSFEEIEAIIAQIDLSTPEGGRNKAILETLYSCGLSVSEVGEPQAFAVVFRCRIYPRGGQRQLRAAGADRQQRHQIHFLI